MAIQTTKLKSRTGCLTCVARKKKCDEKLPRCGHCERLGLSCQSRATQVLVTPTNMREKSMTPRVPVSSGYPPFASDMEKRITLASSKILSPFVSRVADASFSDLPLVGRLCVQSRLVRQAIMAFSVACDPCASESHYKMSLRSYQRCITGIQGLKSYDSHNLGESTSLLTAVCFLGLLEVSNNTPGPGRALLNGHRVSNLVVPPVLSPTSTCAESFSCASSTGRRASWTPEW